MFISKPTFVNSECKYSNISPFLRTFADDFNKICEIENFVETEGKRFFHAGDLNNWYAKFLLDDNPDQLRYSFEMEETFNPIAHEKQFLGELKDIRKIADSFDVVMFPIDGRVGNGK